MPLRTLPDLTPDSLPPGVRLERVTSVLRFAVARRLVSRQNHDLDEAARAFLSNAPLHGIDLRTAYATVEGPGHSPIVREACLPVLGVGRTATLFVSEPEAGKTDPSRLRERALCASWAMRTMAREFGHKVQLYQALPDPGEAWAIAALEGAGLSRMCELQYLRREPRAIDRAQPDDAALPAGVRVMPVSELGRSEADTALLEAMQGSYEQTLDCPELCGLRETPDILRSHRATGEYDPSMWWVVSDEQGRAGGCCLVSLCPQQRLGELVYLGLAQRLRGKGLARHLLRRGIAALSSVQASWPMACAVDARNAPALALYSSEGFVRFARRIALVKPAHAPNL